MNIDTLSQKRTTLVAQRDQILANLNATAGAIAMVDELIAEMTQEVAREKAAEMEAQRKFEDDMTGAGQPIDWKPLEIDMAAVQPEMLPVTRFDPCVACDHQDCEELGCSFRNQPAANVA